MNRLMEKLDVIRGGRRAGSDDDSSGLDSSSKSKLWRFSTSYRESLPPLQPGEAMLRNYKDHHRLLSCVKFAKSSKAKTLVTLLVGTDDEERQIFQVEPQILEHGIVQWLLERSSTTGSGGSGDLARLRAGESPLYEEDILLNCDAILFEHILWLLGKDDPSLRNFNLEELMEFYTA